MPIRCVDVLHFFLVYNGKLVEAPLCITDNRDYIALSSPPVMIDTEVKDKKLCGIFPFLFGQPVVLDRLEVVLPDGRTWVYNGKWDLKRDKT